MPGVRNDHSFPHEGFCDWQFSEMLAGAAAVQFNALPEAFDPILEVASSYKQLRRQAVVFEWRVGEGRLLVCSLNLPKDDPAAAFFRQLLMTYAAGPQFQPRTQVTPEQLDQFVKLAATTAKPDAQTDKAFDAQGHASPKKK